jgi:hypothetical protein
LAATEQAKEQKQNGVLTGETRLRCCPPAKFLVDSLERIRRTEGFPLRTRKAQKGKELIAGFLQALHHRRTPELPFLREPDRACSTAATVSPLIMRRSPRLATISRRDDR